ncbi:hypothetical protein FRC18_011519 [Serendipita sp. 400]|nr:hypothetical protein FRC18_011519 [Serendipita sp. 400]
MYAHALPRFRVALLVQSVHQVICFFIYFPLIFVRSTTAIVTLASLGIAFDLLARYTVGIATVVTKRREKKRQIDEEVNGTTCKEEEESPSDSDSDGDKVIKEEAQCQFDKHRGDTMSTSMPALNIEHFLERTAAFVVIVLGEMVLSIMYHATGSQIGFKRIYGNAICGLMIAFNLCWLCKQISASHFTGLLMNTPTVLRFRCRMQPKIPARYSSTLVQRAYIYDTTLPSLCLSHPCFSCNVSNDPTL